MDLKSLRQKFLALLPTLNERGRRIFAATEARAMRHLLNAARLLLVQTQPPAHPLSELHNLTSAVDDPSSGESGTCQ